MLHAGLGAGWRSMDSYIDVCVGALYGARVDDLCRAGDDRRMPRRVSVKRGQSHPPRTKSVKRPSRWGNPEKIQDDSREERVRVMATFWKHLRAHPELIAEARDATAGLRGWNLACACRADQICHGDVWLEIANGDESLAAIKKRWERDVKAGGVPFR